MTESFLFVASNGQAVAGGQLLLPDTCDYFVCLARSLAIV